MALIIKLVFPLYFEYNLSLGLITQPQLIIIIFQLYFGYSFSFLFGIYVTEADLFGLGWRSAYLLTGLLGLPIAALLFTVNIFRGFNS